MCVPPFLRCVHSLLCISYCVIPRLARSDPNLFANARPELQLKPHNYKIVKMNSAESGGMQVVTDLKSARVALDYITNLGEGSVREGGKRRQEGKKKQWEHAVAKARCGKEGSSSGSSK